MPKMCDSSVNMEVLLTTWGLGDYYSVFENEGITDESFELLDDETMKILFKKSGPRLIFKKKYEDYKRNSIPNQDDISIASTSSTSSTITVLSDDSFTINELDDILMPPPPSPLLQKNVLVEADLQNVPSQEQKQRIVQNSLFANGLENALQKYPEGRLALVNKSKLNNNLRHKISKIVIDELLNNENLILNGKIFLRAAEEIVNIFQNEEKDTYYIPFASPRESRTRQPARGKLWSRYINVRAALRTINSNLKSPNSTNGTTPSVSEDEANSLNFLRTAIEPYAKVVSLWEQTYNIRKRIHKTDTLEHIFNEYPCLQTNFGLELVESDFNQEFSDKIDIVYTTWPKISRAILLEAKHRNIQTANGSDIDTSTQALLLLPLLFSPITIKKGNKEKNWRPTRTEVQESFFFHAQNFAVFEEVLERRRKKLERYNIPLQPFGVAVGNINNNLINYSKIINNIEAFYIVINDKKYVCNSALRCLEILYKSIHSLNLEYSSEAKHVWHFIKELIFKMPASNKNSSTACVIRDINFHLQIEPTLYTNYNVYYVC